MPHNPTRALELLRLGTQNPRAAFRDGQEEAIQHVVDGAGRLLVVQKTGWGKSSVYFIATNAFLHFAVENACLGFFELPESRRLALRPAGLRQPGSR